MTGNEPYDQLLSNNTVVRDAATEGLSNILRTTASEEAFDRELLNARTINDPKTECTRLPSTRKPVMLDEIEYGADTAVTIPFGGQPMNSYMHLPVFVTTFARTVSRRVYDDKDNLLMYEGDIEQFYYMLLLRELGDREVRSFIGTIDLACGTVDDPTSSASVATGAVAYAHVGPASNDSVNDLMKSMPSTYGNLAPNVLLVNNITIWDINAITNTANAGDDLASRTWLEGYKVLGNINGVKLMVTMKNHVVKTDDVYILTDSEHLGRMYILEDATVLNESRGWFLSLVLYNNMGGSLPNGGAFRKVRLSGSFKGDFDLDTYSGT